METNRHLFASGTAIVLIMLSAAAHAQAEPPLAVNQPAATDDEVAANEIVVTGTHIRGLVKPLGASTIAVDREEVKASGVTSTVDGSAKDHSLVASLASVSRRSSEKRSVALGAICCSL